MLNSFEILKSVRSRFISGLNLKYIIKNVQSRSIAGNKPFYIFLFFILFCCEAKTQTEYITNGSFEDIDSCYGSYAPLNFDVFAWSGCKGWSNPIGSSSDLWCHNISFTNNNPPYIAAHFQYPKSGSNLSGFFTNFSTPCNYREYLQNKLSSTLVNGYTYEISFYINQTTYLDGCSPIVFGIKFFNQKYYDNSKLWLTDLIPDVINDYTILQMDTLNWQKVSFNYTARGNENYMIIGNFEDSLHLRYSTPCDTTGWGNVSYAVNYFFIDDVSMIELPFIGPEFPNVFTPNSDGINDVINLGKYKFKDVYFYVYNRWGNLEYETTDVNAIWNGSNKNGKSCVDGNYFYILNFTTIKDEKKYLKGFLQLIR